MILQTLTSCFEVCYFFVVSSAATSAVRHHVFMSEIINCNYSHAMKNGLDSSQSNDVSSLYRIKNSRVDFVDCKSMVSSFRGITEDLNLTLLKYTFRLHGHSA